MLHTLPSKRCRPEHLCELPLHRALWWAPIGENSHPPGEAHRVSNTATTSPQDLYRKSSPSKLLQGNSLHWKRLRGREGVMVPLRLFRAVYVCRNSSHSPSRHPWRELGPSPEVVHHSRHPSNLCRSRRLRNK